MIKKKSKLKEIEKRYCRCVFKVRSKNNKLNPYAICTNSVYNLQNKQRKSLIMCGKNMDLNKLTYKQLKSYLIEKKFKIKKYTKKKTLINMVNSYLKK